LSESLWKSHVLRGELQSAATGNSYARTDLFSWARFAVNSCRMGACRGIVRDMTERKQAEEEMRRSEERFRVALKDSPITVFNQDRDLRYTWIYNPQLYWQHEAIGKTDDEILGPVRAAALTALKQQVQKSGCRNEKM
jgi:PAS domain-containing protein